MDLPWAKIGKLIIYFMYSLLGNDAL